MQTTLTELPGSRVKIEASLDAKDLRPHLDHAAVHYAENLRIPGFRTGRAPAQVVIQRVGYAAVLEEAVRHSVFGWYNAALLDAGVVDPIGAPDLEMLDLGGPGEPVQFTVEVGVRPTATLGEYKNLEVPRADSTPPEAVVSARVEELRETHSTLIVVERPVALGDHVLVDYRVFNADGGCLGDYSDELIEVVPGSVGAELIEAIVGAAAGEERVVEVPGSDADDENPEALEDAAPVEGAQDQVEDPAGADRFAHPESGGDAADPEAGEATAVDRVEPGRIVVVVKEVRERVLPELDDDFAADNSEFETVAALRAGIVAEIAAEAADRVEQLFQTAVVEAATENAQVVVPDELGRARAEEILENTLDSLAQIGIDRQRYLASRQQTREEMIEEMVEGAVASLRRDATLTAVAEAEAIDVGEEELLAKLVSDAAGADSKADLDPQLAAKHAKRAKKALAALRKSGHDIMLVDRVRGEKAVELLVASAKSVPMAADESAAELWSPSD